MPPLRHCHEETQERLENHEKCILCWAFVRGGRGPAARMPTGAQFYYSNLFFLIDVGNLSFEYTGYVIKVITPPRQRGNK